MQARSARRQPPPPPSNRRGYACADVITAIFLLLTVMSASITILLYANPQSPLNPLRVPTYPGKIVIATDWPQYADPHFHARTVHCNPLPSRRAR
jgi:hypothetical protein